MDGHATRRPSAIAATTQMTGLPATFTIVMGSRSPSRISGQVQEAGRSRRITAAVMPMGISHHSRAGSTMNGANSSTDGGG